MSSFDTDKDDSLNNKPSTRKTFGSHIPKIGIPRNSLDTRYNASQQSLNSDGNSSYSISADTSVNTFYPVKELTAAGSCLSVILASDVGSEIHGHVSDTSLSDKHVPGGFLPAIPNPTIVETVPVKSAKKKDIIAELGVAKKKVVTVHTINPNASLLQNILKSKKDEVARVNNIPTVKKRWKNTTALVTKQQIKLKRADKNDMLMNLDKDVDRLLGITTENTGSNHNMLVSYPSEVAELQDKKQDHHNTHGLSTLAKMFKGNKDIAVDTPTIFALLKATHIVGIAAITHRPRDSQEEELSAYEHTLRHYLAFVPELCIVNALRPHSKSLEQLQGVSMFADVSGFTVLCATYGSSNIGQLKNTLNTVMGNIVEEILSSGGDIVSFAGDAIFALWRTHSVQERSSIIPKIIKCSINIQEAVNFSVGNLTLRVKVGLAVGKMFAYFLESNCRNHVAVVGPAVKDVNKAEGCAVAGNIICSKEFLEELPEYERYPYLPSKKGFIQLWPPKNNAKAAVHELLETLGNGNHITLDRCKVVLKISDDLVKQDLLKRYIPDFMRYQLEEGLATGWASQVRSITTLFISLVLADTDRVSVDHSNVQDALTCIDEIVDKMNGTVNKIFTFDKGCTILVAFGTQGFKMNDDPRRALKTAQMIMSSLHHNVNDFKGVSIGVTTGHCYCGVVGHEDRHEYTVIGHQVNKACRIMSNYPFCVACDESTKKLSTLPDTAFTTLPPKILKGVPPGELYFNFSESGEDITTISMKNRLTLENSEKITRLVGRAKELDALYTSMANVESHESSKGHNIIIIESQAGYGKSRLLDHYGVVGRHRKYSVITAPLLMDEMTTPFFALKMIMYKLLQLYKPANAKNKEGVIARYVPDYLRTEMCLLNDLLGTRFKRDSTRDFSYKNLHRVLKIIMKEIVGNTPYLFIMDNVEYMDQQSWEFMTDLATLKKKTILILSMRSTSRRMSRAEQNIIQHQRAKRFVLEPFNRDEIVQFSKAYLNVRKIPLDLEKVIVDKTHGIPLYCEGLLRKMLKEQVIKVVDDLESRRASEAVSRRYSRVPRASFAARMLPQGSSKFLKMRTVAEDIAATDLYIDDMDTENQNLCFNCFSGNKNKVDSVHPVDCVEEQPPDEVETKMCVLNDSIDISSVALPDSIKELFLAQFDRLSVSEQVTIKCCAVLGTHFTISLLTSVLPHRTPAQITQSVRIMMREQMLECGGSLDRITNECRNLKCSKRLGYLSDDDDKLSVCTVMKFKTQFAAEILRQLLLPEQRIRIHETAAKVLEAHILAYEFCCKKEFFGNVFKISVMGESIVPSWTKDRRRSTVSGADEQGACQCHEMFTTIYPQIIRHYREAGTNHSLFDALCSAGALGMALSFTFEAMSYLGDALLLTKTRIRLNDRHKACLSSLLCLAMYLCPTPTTIKLYKEAIHLGGHTQVVYKISCLSYLCGGKRPLPSISEL